MQDYLGALDFCKVACLTHNGLFLWIYLVDFSRHTHCFTGQSHGLGVCFTQHSDILFQADDVFSIRYPIPGLSVLVYSFHIILWCISWQ